MLIEFKDVSINRQDFTVLKDINLEIKAGEFVYVIGKVGSGKSTLFKSLYAEIPVSSGEANVLGFNLRKIKNSQIPKLRRKFGIVFQDFQLLTDRTVDENLEFVLRATGWSNKNDIKERIEAVLTHVGMQKKGYKMPHQLSGGEQQRVVIARALLNSPEVILADEPTGNLDPETSMKIVSLLHEIASSGTSVIMSTHNTQLTRHFEGRILYFDNQTIEEVEIDEEEQNEQ